MVSDNVFGINKTRQDVACRRRSSNRRGIARQLARLWCGLHGHLIMLHFEPNKLSLQCSLVRLRDRRMGGRPAHDGAPAGEQPPGAPRPAPDAASAADQRATGVLSEDCHGRFDDGRIYGWGFWRSSA